MILYKRKYFKESENLLEKYTKEIKKFISNNWKAVLLFICIIAFLMLTFNVFYQRIINADIAGHNIIQTKLKSDTATIIAKFITNFGSATYLIVISIILLVIIKNKKIGSLIILNLALQSILNLVLKNLLRRPRPIGYNLIDETGFSFPSGHSMAGMAFYGFLIYLIYKNIKNKYVKWSVIIFLGVLIVSIGASRIYLGVHYTSDVLAGFLISIAYLVMYTSIIGKTFEK